MPPLRIAQIVKLKPEHADDYIKLHTAVWPTVLKRIADSHICDYSIFYDKQSGILFASFKYTGEDYEGDMKRVAEDGETRRWWGVTDFMQESFCEGVRGSVEGGWWRVLEEVFYVA
ncbi:hypothetical protein Vi05172_g10885 [Venturia inaequalis]|uniref:Rhamnose mutarotase n=1 Tax=Venturia inaequalis TaxID=5025 RepID=A0A8H3YY50_VENIN|nr:hypothetical protein EG327_008196 [Venturia inaequalis]RDI79162.1 hypothetical protein Vi05172_g10885 [Venturia inaequalis]